MVAQSRAFLSRRIFRRNNAYTSSIIILFLHRKVGGWTWVWEMANHLLVTSEASIEVKDISLSRSTKLVNNRNEANSKLISGFSPYRDRFRFSEEPRLTFQTCLYSFLCFLFIQMRQVPVYPSFLFHDLPIGRVLASNVSGLVGRFQFDLRFIRKKHLLEMLLEFFNAYFKTLLIVKVSKEQIDYLVTSNGRDLTSSAIVLAARKHGVKVRLLEVNPLNDTILQFEESPHSVKESWRLLQAYFDLKADNELVTNYFENRLNRNLPMPIYSPKTSKVEVLERLSLLAKHEKIVTFFSSSEHEAPPLQEWGGPHYFFKDQIQVLTFIQKICMKQQLRLIVRRHPNSISSVSLQDSEERSWSSLINDTNIIYLSPSEEINSYDLIKLSTLVLTWASTIALEAAYLGVPSRATSPASWAFTDNMRLKSEKELEDFFDSPTLITIDELSAYVRRETRPGIPFNLFRSHGGRKATLDSLVIGSD